MTELEPTGIENYDTWIELTMSDEPELAHKWQEEGPSVKKALEKETLWILPGYLRSPILVRKPEGDVYRKHKAELARIERTNRPPQEKYQAEQNEYTNFALAHCAYPDNAGLKKIAAEQNYEIFEDVCALTHSLARDSIRLDSVKLSKL